MSTRDDGSEDENDAWEDEGDTASGDEMEEPAEEGDEDNESDCGTESDDASDAASDGDHEGHEGKTDRATNALLAACYSGSVRRVENVLRSSESDAVAQWAATGEALYVAAANGRARVISCLLSHGFGANVMMRADPDTVFSNETPYPLVLPEWDAVDTEAPAADDAEMPDHSLTLRERIEREIKGVNIGDTMHASPIHAACASLHEKAVLTLLQSGACVTLRDPTSGETPLHTLCRTPCSGYSETVKKLVHGLIQSGAHVDDRDNTQATPLMRATRRMHSAVDVLLALGACVDARDAFNATPLMHAALDNNLLAVNSLLAAGADVKACDSQGVTALMAACAYAFGNTEECVRALVGAGADVHARDVCGRTALHWAAAKSGAATLSELLRAGADVHAVDADGRSPIAYALNFRKSDMYRMAGLVMLLLESGARVENACPEGLWSMLLWNPTPERIAQFVGAGLDLNRVYGGRTITHVAATCATPPGLNSLGSAIGASAAVGDRLRWLLAAGAPVNVPSTSAFEVQMQGNVKVVVHTGSTPLHAAAMVLPEATEHLLAAGADPFARNGDGFTPYDVAVQRMSWPAVALLLDRHVTVHPREYADGYLYWAMTFSERGPFGGQMGLFGPSMGLFGSSARAPVHAADDSVQWLRKALDRGLDPNRCVDDSSFSPYGHLVLQPASPGLYTLGTRPIARAEPKPLLLAALSCNIASWDVVRLLVERGADVTAATADGTTVLDFLFRKHGLFGSRPNVECVRRIVDTHPSFARPVMLAQCVRESKRGGLVLARALLRAGVDPNAVCHEGLTSLHKLCDGSSGNIEMLRLLLEHGGDVHSAFNGLTALQRIVQDAGSIWSTYHTARTIGFAPTSQDADTFSDSDADDGAQAITDEAGVDEKRLRELRGAIRLLCDRDADTDIRDSKGRTLLHLGVPTLLCMRACLDVPAIAAHITAVDNAGNTPLHVLCGGRFDPSGLDVFLRSPGVAIDAANAKGATALHVACEKGHVAAVRTLLAHGASVRATDCAGCTPLHVAAWTKNKVETLGLLLDAGADFASVNAAGETAFDAAVAGGVAENVAFLQRRGAGVPGKSGAAAAAQAQLELFRLCKYGDIVGAVGLLASGGFLRQSKGGTYAAGMTPFRCMVRGRGGVEDALGMSEKAADLAAATFA